MLTGPLRALQSPLLLLLAAGLAVVGGAAPAWVVLPCAAWVGAVGLGAWWQRRGDPRTWPGAVWRGAHPGCCALIVDVRRGDEAAADVLVAALRERGVACAVFTAPGVSTTVAAVGQLLPAGAQARGYWRPLGQRPGAGVGGVLVGHSVVLGPGSSDEQAAGVVGTDLVCLHPRLPPARALCWVEEWLGRAVAPAPLDEVLGRHAVSPPPG